MAVRGAQPCIFACVRSYSLISYARASNTCAGGVAQALRAPSVPRRAFLSTAAEARAGQAVSATLHSSDPADAAKWYGSILQDHRWEAVLPGDAGTEWVAVATGDSAATAAQPTALVKPLRATAAAEGRGDVLGEGKPGWLLNYAVESVQAAARAVVDNGGEVEGGDPDNVSGEARCWDVQGGPFVIAERPDAVRTVDCGWTERPPPGALTWYDVLAHCGEGGERRLANFYHAVLSWSAHVELPFPGGAYCMGWDSSGSLESGHKTGGLLPSAALMGGEDKAIAATLPFFAVADAASLDERCDAAVKIGASVLVEPMDIMDGRFSILRDPEGAPFALYDRTDVWDEVREYPEDAWVKL